MEYVIYVWLGMVVLFAVIEAFTLSLNAIWFSFGALLSMVAAAAGWSLVVQIVVFLIGSAALLVLTKPLIKKYASMRHEKTNFDRIIGKIAIVTQPINNLDGIGQIQALGQVWTARSDSGRPIDAGTRVRVIRIEGVKAFVETVDNDVLE